MKIGREPGYAASYRKHLNRYDVIYLDMTAGIGEAGLTGMIPYLKRNVVEELQKAYPQMEIAEGFVPTLSNAAEAAGNPFIAIIDEWDAPIREAKDDPVIQRLRRCF